MVIFFFFLEVIETVRRMLSTVIHFEKEHMVTMKICY